MRADADTHRASRSNETTGYLDWIETFGRDEGSADSIVDGLGTAAIAHTTLGNPSHAATLLTEIIKTPNTHSTPYFAAYLPHSSAPRSHSDAPTSPTLTPTDSTPTPPTPTTHS